MVYTSDETSFNLVASMHYRNLGLTGLRASLISLGTGGPSRLGQSAGLSGVEQDRLIARCFELGINLFDTSEGYGDSERVLGRALSHFDRSSFILATKWKYRVDDELRKPAELIESVENSLRRLAVDHVDLMLFHGLLPQYYHDVVARYYPVMARLREQGKVRFIGFSEMFTVDPQHEGAALALRTAPELWDFVMLKYGILNQYAAKEVLPLAQRCKVGIINMAAVRIKLPDSVLLERLIANWKASGVIPTDSLSVRDPLGWLVRDNVESIIGAGYKFAADHPAISTVLTGTADMIHLEQNVASMDQPYLPREDKKRLVGLFGDIAEYA